MKQPIVIAIIISVALILSAYLIAVHQRYGLVTASNSNSVNTASYKIDKLTGEVWWIIDDVQIAISEEPEEYAGQSHLTYGKRSVSRYPEVQLWAIRKRIMMYLNHFLLN